MSSRGEYTNEPPWLKAYQTYWEAQGYNLDLHDWHRVWSFALARAEPNLHAEFQSGQLAMLMGKPVEGVFTPMPGPRLSNVITQAIEKNLLHDSSKARCLVLPSHAWGCGLKGELKPCSTHHGKPSMPRRFKKPPVRKDENQERRTGVLPGHSVSTSPAG